MRIRRHVVLRLWLLIIVTRPPRTIVTLDGLTRPSAPIVIVAESVGVVGGVVVGGVVDVGGVGVVGVLLLATAGNRRHGDNQRRGDRLERRRLHVSNSVIQKNLREMAKPRCQSSTPPRATWARVVPIPFEKFSWKTWPPACCSMPKLTCVSPGL